MHVSNSIFIQHEDWVLKLSQFKIAVSVCVCVIRIQVIANLYWTL